MARITSLQMGFREFQRSENDILRIYLVAHIKLGSNYLSMANTIWLEMKLSIMIEPHMWSITQNINMYHWIWHKHWPQKMRHKLLCPSQLNEDSSSNWGSDCLAQKTRHKTSTWQVAPHHYYYHYTGRNLVHPHLPSASSWSEKSSW
jgi:hypothetical protein